jgi:hypothetical protein
MAFSARDHLSRLLIFSWFTGPGHAGEGFNLIQIKDFLSEKL